MYNPRDNLRTAPVGLAGKPAAGAFTPTIASGRGVTAVLGPTNTGKTHLAIERLTAYRSGVIGLPLRLLAREVYGRVCDKVGVANVALITGEEKINPPGARYHVCTVEAMPMHTDADFVAIDEVQLASDLERGHVFTDRVLNLRGVHETMLLGAETVRETLEALLPGLHMISRPRMSLLSYAGSKKITRLPRRAAIVAFSANEVYAIAELLRRQRGGAAVVLGSLSPRTRNAQVELYQSGEIDFLVATDAIGMGLNLDLDHVAFAQDQKFDGHQHRRLTAAEMAQIAGRAGRHTRDGTFGVTGHVAPLEDELVMALEAHEFASVKNVVWRNRDFDFSSLTGLKSSLDQPASHPKLSKAPPATDQVTLEALTRDHQVADICKGRDMIQLLWDVAKTPDYRRISPAAHADLLLSVFLDIARDGTMDENWFSAQVEHTDRPEGDIDALSARIAQIRTWTYLSHRHNWLKDPEHWQEKTREVEDRLSDALHEALTKRFIDRRTSVLMKRLRENAMLEAEITTEGNVMVEGHHVGHLQGFRFTPESMSGTPEAKAANAAAFKALAGEIEKRAERLVASPNGDITLASDGYLRWKGEVVASLAASDDVLKPRIILLADEQLTGEARDKVANRLERWIGHHISTLLKPLSDLRDDLSIPGMARGIAFRLAENLGILKRQEVAEEIKSLDQDMRASLRRHGVRFGAYHIFLPAMLKPAPTTLICFLWGLKNGQLDKPGLREVPEISAQGRTSVAVDPEILPQYYELCGFRVLGPKAVRIDILERLADLIRPATTWKPTGEQPKPEGAIDGRSFYVTPAMMSILGATHEDMELILKGLDYRGEQRLESEVKPVEAPKQESAAPKEPAPDAVTTEPQDNTQGTNEPAPAAQDAATEVGSSEPIAQAGAENSEATATAEDDGPKMIMVWRHARSGPRNHQGHTRKGPKGGNRGSDRPDGSGNTNRGKSNEHQRGPKQGKKQQNAKPRQDSKPLDPDNPFAKLAALKASMTKK